MAVRKIEHTGNMVTQLETSIRFARIQSLGSVELIDQEIVTLPNGSRYFFFKGPDGEWLEFFHTTTK
ncbi:hypothetical protein ABU162_06855 [Paenibacillus thiaminolyticus]